jgi:hypothetical protein
VKTPPNKNVAKLVGVLEQAIKDAQNEGYTQIAIVMSKWGKGYQANFCLDDELAEKNGDGSASVYHLLGTVNMLRRFIEESAGEPK